MSASHTLDVPGAQPALRGPRHRAAAADRRGPDGRGFLRPAGRRAGRRLHRGHHRPAGHLAQRARRPASRTPPHSCAPTTWPRCSTRSAPRTPTCSAAAAGRSPGWRWSSGTRTGSGRSSRTSRRCWSCWPTPPSSTPRSTTWSTTFHRDGLEAAWAKFMANAGFDTDDEGAPTAPPGEPTEQDLADSARFFAHELRPHHPLPAGHRRVDRRPGSGGGRHRRRLGRVWSPIAPPPRWPRCWARRRSSSRAITAASSASPPSSPTRCARSWPGSVAHPGSRPTHPQPRVRGRSGAARLTLSGSGSVRHHQEHNHIRCSSRRGRSGSPEP